MRLSYLLTSESGASIVEFALVLPMTLVLMTGLLSFGVYINNWLLMTNATSLSCQNLAASRSTAAASDPCQLVYNSFQQFSPSLLGSGLTFSLTFSGNPTPYTATTCSGAATYVTQGSSVQLTATHSCSLLTSAVNYIPLCTLTSQITEIIQ
jgi:Flp pilus assembly protein TadG